VTLNTFEIGVTFRQLKEAVIKSCTGPLKGIHGMTSRTVFLETGLGMVRAGGCHVILPVAVNTIYPNDIKPYRIF